MFIGWYVEHHIEGWDIEKDLIPLYEGRDSKQYSPQNCFFTPKWLNQWLARTKYPVIERLVNGEYMFDTSYKTSLLGRQKLVLRGECEQDLLEQYILFKDLHFEKRAWEMKEEHKRLCSKYPTTPQISPKLLSIVENFSTEEYLRKKHLERKNSLVV